MNPNDMQRISESLAAREKSNGGLYDHEVKQAARRLVRRTYVLRKPAADGAANTTTAYTAADQIRMPVACRVLGVNVQPQGALAGDDTDYATINVVKGDGAGGAQVVCATRTTKVTGGSNTWAAGATVNIPVSATIADTRIPKGGVLSFSIAKGGAGKAVPICAISVDVEEEDSLDGYKV